MSPVILSNVYVALAQSVITYCIPVWGGATKTKLLELERAQRSLIKVMYFKPYRYPTVNLYRSSGLLSVRQLYLLNVTLYLHKCVPFNSASQDRRRSGNVARSVMVHSNFASRQYVSQSAYIYNQLNSKLRLHHRVLYDCKKVVAGWLRTLTYEETEHILVRIR